MLSHILLLYWSLLHAKLRSKYLVNFTYSELLLKKLLRTAELEFPFIHSFYKHEFNNYYVSASD